MIVKATFHVIPKRVNQLKELVASLGASISLEGETTFEVNDEQRLGGIWPEIGPGDGRENAIEDAGNHDSGLGLAPDESKQLVGPSRKKPAKQPRKRNS